MAKEAVSDLKLNKKLYVVSNVTLGQGNDLQYGGSLLNLSGPSSSFSRTNAPDIVIKVSDSDYPIKHDLNWNYNNISRLTGCYYSGGYKSGRGTSGIREWYNGTNHRFEFQVFSGATEGGSVSFLNSYHIDLTNGDINAKQNLSVNGASTLTGAVTTSSTLSISGDLSVNSNTLYVDTSLQRVGIGTDTPSYNLDVNGALGTSSYAAIGGSLSVTGSSTFYDDISVSGTVFSNVINAGPGPFVFGNELDVVGDARITGDANIGGDTLFVGQSIGKVGIGTTAPFTNLDVRNQIYVGNSSTTASTNSDIRLLLNTITEKQSGDNEHGQIAWVGSNRSVSTNLSAIIGCDTQGTYDDTGSIYFSTSNNGSMPLERMRIKSTGEVEVSEGLAIGSGADADDIPSDGLAINGDIDFIGTGRHRIRFPDSVSGGIGRMTIELDSDSHTHLSNNGTDRNIYFYNNQGKLLHTGWNDLYETTTFKSFSDKGINIFASTTGSVDDEEMIYNESGSGRDFGSFVFQESSSSSLKIKQMYVVNTYNISNVTQASPPVVTATGHGLSNGDKVGIKATSGMTELNDGIFTVANVTTDTFELQGEDSSSYGSYTSGGKVSKLGFNTYTLTPD